MGHPEILDQVPDSRGSEDLTGQSSDDAQHLCVNLAFHRGVLRSWGTDCADLEQPPALGRRESSWWKILFLSFILHETSCHRRNKRMPLDTSSTGLFSAWEQMLTLMVSAPCSLTLWLLLLRDLGRGTVWLLVGFGTHCMLHCPVLCRGIMGLWGEMQF